MTRFNFIADMITMFAPKVKDKDSDETKYDKKTEKDLFFKSLNNFCDECLESNLQSVFNHVEKKHDFATIPKMSMFWKFAEKNKYLAAKNEKRDPYWNICNNCNSVYSKEGRGCPKCRCTSATIGAGETLPENIIMVHEDCFYCSIYPESLKKENVRKMYGTGCSEYGVKQEPSCNSCQCKECCKQMMQYNAGAKVTTEKYKSTELSEPWIKEVEPLVKIAADMLDHMKGRKNDRM